MKNPFIFIFLLISLFYISSSIQGIDTSQFYSIQTYKCILANGYTFSMIQALKSNGTINLQANQNLKNARAAGLITDVYVYPCRGKDPQDQIRSLFSYIDSTLFRTVWINVQTNPSPGCSWSGYSEQQNCNYLTRLINEVKNQGKSSGVYSSLQMWKNIFGITNGCSSVSNQQLWYINYDKKPQFQKFQKFGGWSYPNIKQYQNNVNICGAKVNYNFYHFY